MVKRRARSYRLSTSSLTEYRLKKKTAYMQPFRSMDVYRMNEENVNWIAGSLNFPGIIGSQMTLLLSILTLTLVGMAICLIGKNPNLSITR